MRKFSILIVENLDLKLQVCSMDVVIVNSLSDFVDQIDSIRDGYIPDHISKRVYQV